jgi:serine/threonine protein kinase
MTCPSCAAETGSSSVCAACGAALELPGLAAGTVVAGRYEVQSRLGAGGMGVVYKARDRLLDEVVALKVLRRDVAGSDEMAVRFRSEIRLARAVSHRNVCRIHEYGEEGDLRYVSMAFVGGVDLRHLLHDRGRFSGAETAALAVQIAEALEAIHQEGIVHRDLKPGNVMIDARGVARVMDFGIAKLWDSAGAAGVTSAGQLVGTPSYMSPEQIRGETLDGRSDLYALGIVVFELATGRAPFRANTPLATLYKHVHEPPPLHGPEAELLPPPLVPVLERALAKDREGRFATASEMAAALKRAGTACAGPTAASTQTIAERPPEPPSPRSTTVVPSVVTTFPAAAAVPTTAVPDPRRYGPGSVSLIGLILACLAGAVAAIVILRRPPAAEPRPAPEVGATASIPAGQLSSSAESAARGTGAPASLAAKTTAPPAPASTPKVPPRTAPSSAPAAEGISSAAAMAGLLAEADAALADHAHDVAGSLYDQVLALDPANEKARAGRARVAEALARGPGAVTAPVRFVAGQTRLDSAERVGGPAGFEGSAGVAVRRVEQARSLAAKIYFEVTPAAVSPGDRYTVKAYLLNEGGSAIDVGDVVVTTAVNGRRGGGKVDRRIPPLSPGQRAVLLEAGDVWRAETAGWAMTVTVRTSGGESYTNQLTWQ